MHTGPGAFGASPWPPPVTTGTAGHAGPDAPGPASPPGGPGSISPPGSPNPMSSPGTLGAPSTAGSATPVPISHSGIPAPHPPTYDTTFAPPLPYGGAPAFLPGHPIAPDASLPAWPYDPLPHEQLPGGPNPAEHITEPIRASGRWTGGARPAGVTATVGDVLTVLGGALVLAFSALPFVSYTDGRFVAVQNRDDLPTSWTAWSPSTFLAPLSWVAILAAVAVAAGGVLRVLDRGHRTLFGLTAGQVRVLLAGLSFLILFSFAVSSKTVLFGDDQPQLTKAGVLVDSTLSLDSGGYLMLLAALALLVGAAMTARGAGGPVVWPLPEGVRTMFAERTPRPDPEDAGQTQPVPTAFGTPDGYGPGASPPGAYYPTPQQMAAYPPAYPPGYPPQR